MAKKTKDVVDETLNDTTETIDSVDESSTNNEEANPIVVWRYWE